MDEYVVKWLKEWELDDLVDRFREEEVGERAFRNLPDEIIRELIPKLGKRAIFLTNYACYKQNLQNPPAESAPEIDSQEDDTDTTSEVPVPFRTPPQQVPFSIEEISCITREDQEAKVNLLQLLERTPSAVHLIKKEFFTRKDRDLLSHVVIQHLWPECCEDVLPQDTLLLWSRAVEFLFCHEIASIYCRLDEDGELHGIFIKCITGLKQRVARDKRLGTYQPSERHQRRNEQIRLRTALQSMKNPIRRPVVEARQRLRRAQDELRKAQLAEDSEQEDRWRVEVDEAAELLAEARRNRRMQWQREWRQKQKSQSSQDKEHENASESG
ncbi:uncharacterized protein LOC125954845 isoform X1 [Anopheles darlingi]|uniref:uncharacterized protein LOC125954845 isoform X1 n=1 Tax=Anopheles darlingi TaxID=43151 RepID=UPI002100023F|nr:uncharacterized protein LOC125954845 isoform X1 [Anopheles darlingi]